METFTLSRGEGEGHPAFLVNLALGLLRVSPEAACPFSLTRSGVGHEARGCSRFNVRKTCSLQLVTYNSLYLPLLFFVTCLAFFQTNSLKQR
jgi:hypothetical protein